MASLAANVLYAVTAKDADDLLDLRLGPEWQRRTFRGPALADELRHALAEPPPPSAALVDCSLDRPIDYARQIRAAAGSAQLIFACTGEQAERFPHTIRAFPTIGSQWAVVARGPRLVDRIREQLDLVARRRRHRTTLDRVNLRLKEPPALDQRALHRLVVSERYLAAIVENAPDAIVTVSPELEVLGWNASATALWHVPPGAAVGRTFDAFLDPACRDAFRSALREMTASSQFIRREFAAAVEMGVVPIEATITPVFGDDGGLLAFTVIAHDITLRKAAEKSAREHGEMLERLVAERTAKLRETINQLEQFSYTVSHDLRGPLRAMQGYADTLLKDHQAELSPDAKMCAERIARSAVRMDRLTQDVLAYSRVATVALQKKVVELDPLIPELGIQLCGEERAAVFFEIRRPLAAAIAHEALLAQALSNLMSNAIKFVAPGRRPQVKIWTERTGRDVRVFISDNGIGIPAEHSQRVFEMFERGDATKDYEGTGVGLAIVKKSIERLGGEVGFTSEVGKGTTFWIELPAAR